MIKTLLILSLPACALIAQAQGTFEFTAALTGANEVPPNTDPTTCTGTFVLTGDSLTFDLKVPAVTFIAQNAYIQGPAPPGSTAPIIFNLGGPVFHGGGTFGSPAYYEFFSPFDGVFGAGPFMLSNAQINGVESDLWYANVTSAALPTGQLRGQILEVPEPDHSKILALAALALFASRFTLRHVHPY